MLETILTFLSQPAVWGFLTTVGVTVVGWITKKNVNAYRWDRITSILYQVVKEIYAKGNAQGWAGLAVSALKTLQEIVQGDPSLKNLTPTELELLKPLVLSYARAVTGVVEKPMQ